jgi:hypothetical protein
MAPGKGIGEKDNLLHFSGEAKDWPSFKEGKKDSETHTFDPYTCIHARVHKQENPVPTVKTDAVKTMLAACFLALLLAPPHASISCSIVVRDSK